LPSLHSAELSKDTLADAKGSSQVPGFKQAQARFQASRQDRGRLWFLGDISAKVIQELAQAAAKPGCNQADVVGLASLGTHGLHPNHVQHQMVSRCFKDMAALPPTQIETKAWGKSATGQKIQVDCSLPVLLPHHWMMHLEDQGDEILGIQEISNFLKSRLQGSNPRISQSQGYFGQAFKDTQALVPFALHADAAPHSKVDNPLVIYMKAITSRRSVDTVGEAPRSRQALKLDVLHVLDLGVSCHAVGILLWEIIDESKPGVQDDSTYAGNVEALDPQDQAGEVELGCEASGTKPAPGGCEPGGCEPEPGNVGLRLS
ncbi:unnamed protein product, partial [Symbiodinium sp. KB8]